MKSTSLQQNKQDITMISICDKELLTLSEAAVLYNIGINKIRDLTNDDNCPFVLFVGNKRLIKRRQFNSFLSNAYSI